VSQLLLPSHSSTASELGDEIYLHLAIIRSLLRSLELESRLLELLTGASSASSPPTRPLPSFSLPVPFDPSPSHLSPLCMFSSTPTKRSVAVTHWLWS